VELGAEALRGDAFPAGGAANDGVGSYSAFVKTGDDLGTENSWKAGISYLHYDAEGRTSAVGETDTLSFDGNGEVWILEAVWKWSENGNPKLRNLILQGEYLRREENGKLVLGATATEEGSVDTTQDAFYLQGVYQFVPGWRFGLRYDRLKADNSVAGLTAATALDGDDRSPERWTAMADYSPSEFSRLRLQLSEDSSSADSDTRLILQYVMSLGSHGAHSF
jgi:hypothetical protein